MRILLTGGRAPATLELARLLNSSGAHLILAESLPFTLGSFSSAFATRYRLPFPRQESLAFAHRVLDIVRKEAIDLIIPTCEEIFHLMRYEEIIRPHCEIFAPEFVVLKRLHNKWLFNCWMIRRIL